MTGVQTCALPILKKGDKLFLYTDGIPEAVNSSKEQYGMDRLQKILKINEHEDLNTLIGNVRTDVDAFTNGAQQFDDITMLCMEYKENK